MEFCQNKNVKRFYEGIASITMLQHHKDNDNDDNCNNDDICDIVSHTIVFINGPSSSLVPILLILFVSLLFVAFSCLKFKRFYFPHILLRPS